MLVILADDSKPRDPSDYDKIVCAELPDPVLKRDCGNRKSMVRVKITRELKSHATVLTCIINLLARFMFIFHSQLNYSHI